MYRLLATFSLCLSLSAQQQTAPSKTAIVEGRVENEKTGEPVRRVKLTLRPSMGPNFPSMGNPQDNAAGTYTATTDAEGKFRIDSIDPGSFRLSAERQGFLTTSYGARRLSTMGTVLQLSANQEMKGLTIKLAPHAILTGRVLDDEGEPVARANVQLLAKRYFRGKLVMMAIGGAMTADTGEFRIAEVRPGRYLMSAAIFDRSMMMGDAPARNTSGKPEEQFVTTYYPSTLEEKGARILEVEAGQQTPGLDITLRKSAVYRVRGKVTGLPGSNRMIRMMVMPADGGYPYGQMMSGPSGVKEDGSFELAGLRPGAYTLSTMSMQSAGAGARAKIEISRENLEDVVLAYVQPGSIPGLVRLEGGIEKWETENGKKFDMASLRVSLMSTEPNMFGSTGGGVKEDGTVAINSSAGGKARAFVGPLPQGVYLKSILAGDQELIDTGIDFSSSPPARLEFILAAGVGQVAGTVQDAKQQPAPGAIVTMMPRAANPERMELNRTTSTDQAGRFTLTNIPPGEYDIIAWEDVEVSALTDPEFIKPHESSKKRIEIKPGGQAQTQLVQVAADAVKPR